MTLNEMFWWIHSAILLMNPFLWLLIFGDLNGFLGNDRGITRADILILREEVAALEQTLNELRAHDA